MAGRSFFTAVRRLLPTLLGLILLGAIIFWMAYGFHSRVEPGEAPYERRPLGGRTVVAVRPLTTTETIAAVGTVRPRRETEVASQVLATIQAIPVSPGQAVAAGQLLVRLDDREIQAQLREVEAAAAGVQADLAVRERDYARYQRMFAENAVTKEDYDRVEGAYRATEAQLRRAQQQVERTQVMLSYCSIQAQEAGLVSDRYADPGNLAVPGKPLLSIHDPGQLELHASVRESLAAHIRLDQVLQVKVDAARLDVQGTVREIVPQAETASRSVLVKVALPPDSTTALYTGMFGRLEIPVGQLPRIVVPAEAVQAVGQLELVDVVDDDETLERRFVRTGQRLDGDLEILSGLEAGERVALPPSAAVPRSAAGAARSQPPR